MGTQAWGDYPPQGHAANKWLWLAITTLSIETMLLTSTTINKGRLEVCTYFQPTRTRQETNVQTPQHGTPAPSHLGPNSILSIQLLSTDAFPYIIWNIRLVTVFWICFTILSFLNALHNCFIMPRISSIFDNMVKGLLILSSPTSSIFFYLSPDTLLSLSRVVILLSASGALYTYFCYINHVLIVISQ